MKYLLNGVYLVLIVALAPWLAWQAIRTGKYREGFREKLFGLAPIGDSHTRRIWLHAVSVGEVQLLRALIPAIEQAVPQSVCVISTTTRTGMQMARTAFPEHTVFYAPLDFSWAVARAIQRVRPALVVLVELELWPNWIGELHRQQVPVMIVNGRLSEKSFSGYRRIKPFVSRMLKRLDIVATQTKDYAHRFVALGASPQQTVVTGSIKFDNVVRERNNPRTLTLAAQVGIAPSDSVFLAGSTQHPEEEIVLEAASAVWKEFPDWRLVLVPRHPERFEQVAKLLDQSGLCWTPRSHHQAETYHGSRWQVLLVDTVGELASWWGVAQGGFVGGSLGNRGGQNMMEPAAYGVAVSFGPNTKNFKDVVELLLSHQAAEVVTNSADLTRFLRRCVADPDFARQRGDAARQVVAAQGGATAKTIGLIRAFFDESPDATQTDRDTISRIDGRHDMPCEVAGETLGRPNRRFRVWN